ncbi:MAG: sugar ABC transporter permease [Chloroflexota bacterium]|nr:sugar ABC transporter permease [Chloroflexota bacterium]MDE2947304.1 sugar ABC transporter permease [Chloroflexota bacterium]
MARDLSMPDDSQYAKTPGLPRSKSKRGGQWTRYRLMRYYIVPWLFLIPILGLHAFVVVIPAMQGVYYSFTDWSGIGEAKFIGLRNFEEMFFEDQSYIDALSRNVQWMIFRMIVPFTFALFGASLLAKVKRGAMIYRTALFMPFILPSIVTATIWRYLYNPRFGLPTLVGYDKALLGQSDTALWAIAFADNWQFWGFLMVLFLTAMQGIDPVLYDAAKVDGANRWQEFWHVTLPGIRPVVLFMMMMVMIWAFLVFDYVFILTGGGPAGATEVIAIDIYKNAFQRFEAGYAAAQGMTICLFASLVVSAFAFLRKRGWDI